MAAVLFIEAFEFVDAGVGGVGARAVEVELEFADGVGAEMNGAEDGAAAGNFVGAPFVELEGEGAAAGKEGADEPGVGRGGGRSVGGGGEIDLDEAFEGNVEKR